MDDSRRIAMTPFDTIYDISVMLGKESIDYPGDPPYAREVVCAIGDGAPFALSRLRMSAHSGTHIDFPAHFIRNGRTQEEYDVSRFILNAQVVEIRDPVAIRPGELAPLDIKPGEALLFKTDNSRKGLSKSGLFSQNYVYLSSEGAAVCAKRGVSLVGIDYVSIDGNGDETFPAHRNLLENDILILEGIRLEGVSPGAYTLVCLPLNMSGGEASPVRAVLLPRLGN
jgi:arylformamidase